MNILFIASILEIVISVLILAIVLVSCQIAVIKLKDKRYRINNKG